MNKQVLLLLVGLPASGKSTEAKNLEAEGWVRVNWDDIRLELNPEYRFSHETEKQVRRIAEDRALSALAAGKSVVVDNTNLNHRTRERWHQLAQSVGVPLVMDSSFLDIRIEELIRRDAQREGKARVGRHVIERMALDNGLLHFPVDKQLVLVDMDGTLSDVRARRQFVESRPCTACNGNGGTQDSRCPTCRGTGRAKKDWNAFFEHCNEDEPIEAVLKWVKALSESKEYEVVIVSGRPMDKAGFKTTTWLEKYGVKYRHIFMRKGGDKRDDTVVKQEILNRLPKERIAFVIDDRQRVVDMWRANGVKVYQVAEGNF